MTDEMLADLLGPSAMLDFKKATEAERYRIRSWVPMLSTLTDEAFLRTCVDVVSVGAVSESRRSLDQEPYIKAAACIQEAKRRHEGASHASGCRGDDLYKQAFNQAMANFGLTADESNPCTCRKG